MSQPTRGAARHLAFSASLLIASAGLASASVAAPIEQTDLPEAEPSAATVPAGSFTERIAAAEAAYGRGDYEAAITSYGEAVRLAPAGAERVKTLVILAALQQQQGMIDGARRSLFDAVYLDPALDLRADLYTPELVDLFYAAQLEAFAARVRETGRLVRSAREAADRGDLGGARTLLEGALTLVANDPSALLQMAALDLREGRRQEALAGYERLVSLRMAKPESVPNDIAANALANLGKLYVERGLHEDGAARLREALAIDPSIGEAWIQLALAQRALGRREEARDSLLQARALRPGDENVLHNLGIFFVEAGRFTEAAALLRDATERNPESARLWQLLGSALRSGGDKPGARDAFARVLILDPANLQGLAEPSAVHLAQLAYEMNDDVAAEREARRALAWNPADPRALDLLGLTLQRKDDLEGAIAAFQGAVTADPARAETFNYLGSIFYRQARWADAENAFSRALTLRPSFVEAQDNLALTRKRQLEVETISRQLGFAAEPYDRAGALKGIRATKVQAASVAGKAGLQEGDILVRVEGAPVETPADLHAYLTQQPPPRGLAIEVLRLNKLTKLKFKFPR